MQNINNTPPTELEKHKTETTDYDAVVVGGGIAGLTAASKLAQKNHRVLLLEKELQVGGLASGYTKQGFTFDCGIRALENAGTLIPMLEGLGINAELIKSDVYVRIAQQNTIISNDNGLAGYSDMLETLFPDNKSDIEKIITLIKKTMKSMDVLYGIDNPLFSPLWEQPLALMKQMLPWFTKYLATVAKINLTRTPVRKKLESLTENTALVDMVVQHFFSGSATFFALGYFWLYKDYYYPRKSTSEIGRLMVEFINKNGGEVRCGERVEKIAVDDKKIQLHSGEVISYNRLIWCCSKKGLINGVDTSISEKQSKIIRQKGSDSVLTLCMAVDFSPEHIKKNCGSHMFFTPYTAGLSSIKPYEDNATEEELMAYVRDYLQLTTYEISCPTVHNLSLAPTGKCSLIVGSLFSYDLTQRIQQMGGYDYFVSLCVETIVNLLDQTLLQGLTGRLLFCDCFTPLDVQKRTGNDNGAITGWSHYSNPMPAVTGFTSIAKSVVTDYPNIYQAGMWTFSPAGFPVSIITGRLAADKAISDISKLKTRSKSITE